MKSKRIGVLMGGWSAEREVSIMTGEAVSQALTQRGHAVVPIFVDRDIDQQLRQEPIDAAFIALHGSYGEDGCIQGLLELLAIPYTGPGVMESALAMDKLKSKEMFRLHNVSTPPYYVLEADALSQLETLHGHFGFPVFVKPRYQGSSIGCGRADDMAELRARCREALQYGPALVERFVGGMEVAVGLLDGRALGAIEIVPGRGVYDYRAKYQKGASRYHLPPRLARTRYDGVLRIAERAVAALGTPGAVRADLLISEGENEYVLEVNTLPGMTPTSLLPKIAASAGYDFGALCEAILERATLRSGHGPRPEPLDDAAAPALELVDAQAS